MITFRAKAEIHYRKHLGLYLAFGISAYQDRRRLLHIPDVFCRWHQALDFVRRCNRYQPELIHLHELIEDEM